MKQTIVGIFAHPDDEAFGPGGTLAKLAKQHTVYLLCVTNGDAKNGQRKEEIALGKIRKKELQQSAEILGVKKVFFLGYRDGSLNNNIYHELADRLQESLETLRPEQLITFEPRGISGHTDHIVVSNVTSFIFHKMPSIKKLWYYCQSQKSRELAGNYFIHMPPGYAPDEITHMIDVSEVWKKKLRAMQCHISQQQDIDRTMKRQEKLPKEEYFIEVSQ